jgi:hypothetical protein
MKLCPQLLSNNQEIQGDHLIPYIQLVNEHFHNLDRLF